MRLAHLCAVSDGEQPHKTMRDDRVEHVISADFLLLDSKGEEVQVDDVGEATPADMGWKSWHCRQTRYLQSNGWWKWPSQEWNTHDKIRPTSWEKVGQSYALLIDVILASDTCQYALKMPKRNPTGPWILVKKFRVWRVFRFEPCWEFDASMVQNFANTRSRSSRVKCCTRFVRAAPPCVHFRWFMRIDTFIYWGGWLGPSAQTI